MLDRLAKTIFEDTLPQAMLHEDLSQELEMGDRTATLRLKIPFAGKPEIELKKVGLELVVRVANQKRNIMLPQGLASYRPRGAKFDGGSLTVTFERPADGGAGGGGDRRTRQTARNAL
jgi:hypothetical protein